jgi:rod shape determining protein RodA
MIAKDVSSGGGKIDTVLLSLYLALVGIGWLMIYAVGYKQGYTEDFNEFMIKTVVGKQTMFIAISILLILIIFSIDAKFWRVFAYPIYGFGLVLLVLVLIFGKEINGAKAWFSFGGFGFQPAEVAKLGTCLVLSSYLSSPSTSLRDSQATLTILGLLALPMCLIMLQPDAGSMLVFLSFSIMMYREGLSGIPFLIAFAVLTVFILALLFEQSPNEVVMYLMMLSSLIFAFNIAEKQRIWLTATIVLIITSAYFFFNTQQDIALFLMLIAVLIYIVIHSRRGRFRMVILTAGALLLSSIVVYSTSFAFKNILKKHQQDRIDVWLRPDRVDPHGAAYNLNNSKLAIGSGGFQGKGYLDGTLTKLNFVPEQQTDFIFCTIGEEQGFIGVFAVLAIFVLFLIRIVQVAERQKLNFVRLYAYGLAGIYFFHFFINIGMTMGLVPVIGIPLPFISGGGSSLLGFTAMLAILLKLDSHRYTI